MMSRLLFYLVIKPLSYLPLDILYFISDFIYLVIYKVFKYRQSVVRTNLLNSFPGKSIQEIKTIEQKFYRHFCDLIIESIRLFSISEKEAARRSKIVNPEVMNQLYDEGKSLILVGGHYNNWELTCTILDTQVKHHIIGIYTPMTNKFFDNLFNKSRSRFGMEMLSKKIVREGFQKNKDQLTATLFATDQSPTFSKNVHWTQFLHQPTAVLLGTELYAKEYDYPVVFVFVKKIRRGYFELEAHMMERYPRQTAPGEITEKHTRWLEKQIQEKPEFWLWSHKRWKRKMKPGDEMYNPWK